MGDPVKESIQARGRGEAPASANVLLLMAQVGQLLPNWWSRARDIVLRSFWKKVDTYFNLPMGPIIFFVSPGNTLNRTFSV